MTPAQQSAFTDKLRQVGLPHEEINVFGVIRCNVHIVCLGADTADKWRSVLYQVSKVPPTVVETVRRNKRNKGTFLLPSRHKAYLIAVAF